MLGRRQTPVQLSDHAPAGRRQLIFCALRTPLSSKAAELAARTRAPVGVAEGDEVPAVQVGHRSPPPPGRRRRRPGSPTGRGRRRCSRCRRRACRRPRRRGRGRRRPGPGTGASRGGSAGSRRGRRWRRPGGRSRSGAMAHAVAPGAPAPRRPRSARPLAWLTTTAASGPVAVDRAQAGGVPGDAPSGVGRPVDRVDDDGDRPVGVVQARLLAEHAQPGLARARPGRPRRPPGRCGTARPGAGQAPVVEPVAARPAPRRRRRAARRAGRRRRCTCGVTLRDP